jgi:hypothetical protein
VKEKPALSLKRIVMTATAYWKLTTLCPMVTPPRLYLQIHHLTQPEKINLTPASSQPASNTMLNLNLHHRHLKYRRLLPNPNRPIVLLLPVPV